MACINCRIASTSRRDTALSYTYSPEVREDHATRGGQQTADDSHASTERQGEGIGAPTTTIAYRR